MDFADLVKDAKSCDQLQGFLFPPMSHKHGLAVQNGGLRSRYFKTIAGNSVHGWNTSVSALGEDKKRKLFGVTFSFKNLLYISVSRYECLVTRFDFDHRKIKDNCYTYLPI